MRGTVVDEQEELVGGVDLVVQGVLLVLACGPEVADVGCHEEVCPAVLGQGADVDVPGVRWARHITGDHVVAHPPVGKDRLEGLSNLGRHATVHLGVSPTDHATR
ncbi:hypothetical protein ACFFHC_09040 [Kytococcus schroeteri]|uniref:hypothetical protein n=1 Tax=Kytococcus schroeteri TaxID=138300 RepID=UPI0035E902A9